MCIRFFIKINYTNLKIKNYTNIKKLLIIIYTYILQHLESTLSVTILLSSIFSASSSFKEG